MGLIGPRIHRSSPLVHGRSQLNLPNARLAGLAEAATFLFDQVISTVEGFPEKQQIRESRTQLAKTSFESLPLANRGWRDSLPFAPGELFKPGGTSLLQQRAIMLNTPRFNTTSIHQRFSRQLSAMTAETRKPTLQILAGSSQLGASIIEANGYDIHLSTEKPLSLRQRIVTVFRSEIASLDVAIPGIVHWVNSRVQPIESAVVLQEPLPDELAVRPPGCVRNGIRFACKVHGKLSWNQTDSGSLPSCRVDTPATAMNYSRDGFCVHLNQAPAIGTEVSFNWQGDRANHSLQGIVRWVIGQSGGAMAGCEIIDAKGYLLSGVDV